MPTRRQIDVIRQLYARAQKLLDANENAGAGRVLGAYRQAEQAILEQLHQVIDTMGQTPDFNLMARSGRLTSLVTSIHHAAVDLAQKVSTSYEADAAQQFMEAYQHAVYALDQATPDNKVAVYAPPPESAVKVLANTSYKGVMFSQRIGIITDAMASDIRDQLMQGLVNGESMAAVGERIQDVIGAEDPDNPKAYAYRALRIARTEIMRVSNFARDMSYAQNSDIVEDDEWEVAPDDKSCDWCVRRDGLTDEEIEKADPGDDPWGNSTDQPLHPNCRCTSVPKLRSWQDLLGLDMPEEFEDDERGMRDEETGDWEIAPVQSFDAWKAARLADMDQAEEA